MLHTPQEFAEFTEGESRFIAAAWRDEPQRAHFVLEDGRASIDRSWAKQRLRCIFPDCSSPEITTVSRSVGRDGFRHLRRRDAHTGPEGIHHLTGKAVLAAHFAKVQPELDVRVEWAIDTQRTRIADVGVTHPETQQRYGFEIQYASMSVEQWRERTDDYQAAGVRPVWLYGHSGGHLIQSHNPYEGHRGVRLTAIQLEAIERGHVIAWLNPDLELIAFAAAAVVVGGEEFWRPAKTQLCTLRIEPLAGLRVTETGITTPGLQTLMADERRYLAAQAVWDDKKRRKAEEDAERKEQEQLRREREAAVMREHARAERARRVENLKRAAAAEPGLDLPTTARCTTCGGKLDGFLATASTTHLTFPNGQPMCRSTRRD